MNLCVSVVVEERTVVVVGEDESGRWSMARTQAVCGKDGGGYYDGGLLVPVTERG